MKKILFVALALLASASFSTASAQSKKEKKNKKKQQTEMSCCQNEQKGACQGEDKSCEGCPGHGQCAMQLKPAPLTTANDSISYAAGYMLSDGLEGYLKQQLQLTDEDMPYFLQGYRQAIARREDPKQKGLLAGMQVAQMVSERMVPRVEEQYNNDGDSLNEALIYAGFEAALRKDTTHYDVKEAKAVFEGKMKEVTEQKNAAAKAEGEQFLAENAKKDGVVTLPSGLQYKVLKAGTGNLPTVNDKVQVIYEGRTIDGNVFDATSKHNLKDVDYDEFNVKGLIKGWQEALTIMPVGSKWEIYIPYDLAYGERGAGKDIKPFAALIFTMELKGIVEPKKDTVTPTQKANPKTVRSQTAPSRSKKK